MPLFLIYAESGFQLCHRILCNVKYLFVSRQCNVCLYFYDESTLLIFLVLKTKFFKMN